MIAEFFRAFSLYIIVNMQCILVFLEGVNYEVYFMTTLLRKPTLCMKNEIKEIFNKINDLRTCYRDNIM